MISWDSTRFINLLEYKNLQLPIDGFECPGPVQSGAQEIIVSIFRVYGMPVTHFSICGDELTMKAEQQTSLVVRIGFDSCLLLLYDYFKLFVNVIWE